MKCSKLILVHRLKVAIIDLHHTWYNFINNNVENMGIKEIPSPMFLVFVFSVLQVSSVLSKRYKIGPSPQILG
jgi:hypothetical protein